MRQWFAAWAGGLKLSPKQFWRTTITEFLLAIEGHNDANRVKPKPMTMEEFEELEAANPPSGSIRKNR